LHLLLRGNCLLQLDCLSNTTHAVTMNGLQHPWLASNQARLLHN
jgi:hypothetical protein